MKKLGHWVFLVVVFSFVVITIIIMTGAREHRDLIREVKPMEMTSQENELEPLLIRSIQNLIRFRLVYDQHDLHLISAADSFPEPHEVTTDDQARGVRWLVFDLDYGRRKVELKSNVWCQAQRIKNFDLWIEGIKCLWIIESNIWDGPLMANETSWTDAASSVPPFRDGQMSIVDLHESRQNQVEVGISWHYQLKPERWLFNPRVRKGLGEEWLLICNALDGHLLELRGPIKTKSSVKFPSQSRKEGESWEEVRFVPDRFSPVAIQQGNCKVTAFLQLRLSRNLFYSLPRYSGPPIQGDPKGVLSVEIDGATQVDLSTTMGLGAVHAFDMDAAGAQRFAIAALHDKGGEPKLTVLSSIDGAQSWKNIGSLPLEGYADKVSLRAAGDGLLYVAYSLVEYDFSIIKMFALPWQN